MNDAEKEELRAKVESLYDSDLTGKEVAQMLGVPEGTVSTWWRGYRLAHGLEPARRKKKYTRSQERKGKHLTTEELEQVRRLLESGMKDRRIAEIMDVNSKSIWRYRRKWKINCPEEPVKIDENKGPNSDRHLCKACIYRAKDTNGDKFVPGCDYVIHEDESRMCPVDICDKFKRGPSLTAYKRTKEASERSFKRSIQKELLNAAIKDRPDIARVLDLVTDKEKYRQRYKEKHGKEGSAIIQPGAQDGARLD